MVSPLAVDGAFWNGRRVLITGHTGFKGGWLALWLQSLGAEVSGLALAPPTVPNLFEAARIGDGMAGVLGDIRDPAAVDASLAASRPEVVIHMAAQPLVQLSYAEPVETYAVNVMGTVHLLDAVRRTPSVRAVVIVTSDKCYENREWLWGYRETEAMGGYDPYSSSKGCAELVTAAWRRSFFPPERYGEHGVAVASARAGNVIGGGDWAANRLVPDAMRAFLAGEELVLRNPHAVRPWQHVLEPLSGYLCLAERLCRDGVRHADGWNFGPHGESEQTVGTVVQRLSTLWGPDARWRIDGDARHPHEAGLLALDSAKARNRLGWSPRWSLDQALAASVDWYRAWDAGADMRAVTLQHIAAYTGGNTPSTFAATAEGTLA